MESSSASKIETQLTNEFLLSFSFFNQKKIEKLCRASLHINHILTKILMKYMFKFKIKNTHTHTHTHTNWVSVIREKGNWKKGKAVTFYIE